MNLCFQQGLSRKPSRWTQMLDLIALNHGVNNSRKVLEDTRRHQTEEDCEKLLGGADQPHLQAGWPMGPPVSLRLTTSVLHCLKDRIYTIYSSQFDPRV